MEKIKILFAEDLPEDAEIAQREIKKEIRFSSRITDNEQDFTETLMSFQPDIIISDYSMPEFDGMQALKITRSLARHIPFIVLTGSMNEETAVRCMKAGATDYVIKEQIKRLPFAVREALEKSRERKEKARLTQMLKDSELHYRTSFENSKDGILIISREGELIDFNTTILSLSGYHRNEFLKMRVQNILPEYDEKAGLSRLDHLSEHNYLPNFETYILTAENEQVPVEISAALMQNFGDHPIVIQANIRDVTERRKTEKELLQALEKAEESDRLKTAFLANMSHEIRTPMNGILGFISLLGKPDLDPDLRKEYMHLINKSSARLLNTINDLIDISRLETGQVSVFHEAFNLNTLLDELLYSYQDEADNKNLVFVKAYELDSETAVIETDQEKLKAILSNLIKNALKFTSEGSVTVGYNVLHKNASCTIGIYVQDTGIGIPADRRDAIFNRFEQADIEDTRAFEGSGLGLSIAKAYTELLDGKIFVESEEGKGSVFRIVLPCIVRNSNIRNQQVMNDKERMMMKPKEEMTILIAEDDDISTTYLEALLHNSGALLLFTQTGKEAVEMCRKHPGIDLILMDIKMPGMDGYQATREIRKFNKDVFIVAQTAYALKGDREAALDAGCNDYLTKPINQEDLHTVIEKVGAVG